MKPFILSCLFLLSTLLFAGSVTFSNTNQLMNYVDTWMFNSSSRDQPFYRYYDWTWDHPKIMAFGDLSYTRRSLGYYVPGPPVTYLFNPKSNSELIGSYNSPFLSGVTFPDTTYHFVYGERNTDTNFKLTSFDHINTVDNDDDWMIQHEAGDIRMFSGATITIEQNIATGTEEYIPVTKLRLLDCSFISVIPYPGYWGSGQPTTGYGWGTIDTTTGDSEWLAAYANETGQAQFDFSSPSSVVQLIYGLYNCHITVHPSSIKRTVCHADSVWAPYQLDASATNDVILNVQSGNYYTPTVNTDHHSSMVAKYYIYPTGVVPANIDKVYQGAYWQLGTTYNDCTVNAVFDLSSVPGIDTPQNIRLLRRNRGFGSYWVDANASVISLHPLRLEVSGFNIMGEYCVASTGGNNLEINAPLNLTVTHNPPPEEYFMLEWEPVSNATFYNVFAADSPDAPESSWVRIAHLAHPISAMTTGQNPDPGQPKRFYFVKAEK